MRDDAPPSRSHRFEAVGIASGRAYAPRVLQVMVPLAARLAMSPALKPAAHSSLCLAMPPFDLRSPTSSLVRDALAPS